MERIKDYLEWAMDDIIFENRNKAYGSYQNKRAIPQNVIIGLTASLLGFVMLSIALATDWNSLGKIPDERQKMTHVHLAPSIKVILPPPPLDLPPPVRPSVRFTEMIVKEESGMEEDENPAPLYETEVLDISSVTNVGDTGVKLVKPDTLPPVVKKVPIVDTPVYEFVDQRPEFPGGDAALVSFVQSRIRYPDAERARGIEGNVLVVFVVKEDGSVYDVKVSGKISPGLDTEAARVVKMLSGFRPGRKQGRVARVYFHIPVPFDLKF